ncbi:MAG: GNAT family N-acetyltransferase [bacterium]
MITIRKAIPEDEDAIKGLFYELDLVRPALALDGFWVAEQAGSVVGIAHAERVGERLFVSSVGVGVSSQGRGVGERLMLGMLARERREAWLYTVIPGFFERLGFAVAAAPADLPPRKLFGCDACEPEKCVCMMRPADAP